MWIRQRIESIVLDLPPAMRYLKFRSQCKPSRSLNWKLYPLTINGIKNVTFKSCSSGKLSKCLFLLANTSLCDLNSSFEIPVVSELLFVLTRIGRFMGGSSEHWTRSVYGCFQFKRSRFHGCSNGLVRRESRRPWLHLANAPRNRKEHETLSHSNLNV